MMDERILLSPPDVRDLERDYVRAAIDSNWVAPAGPALDAFEAALGAVTGRRFAVGLTSGTAAMHLALLMCGVRPGDDVICSTLTFVGSAAPITYCGATPVFVDSEPTSWNMDPALLEEALAQRAAAGRPPAAVVAVDLYGLPADYAAIVEICERYGVVLIEDAAEAIGARHVDGPAGSFGAMGILSFNGNKMITTGGGGALVTDDEQLAKRCRFLSTQAREPVLHYEHREIGFNYRLSNISAALGLAQLERLDDRIDRRREIYSRYRDGLCAGGDMTILDPPPWGTSNHWLSCVLLAADAPFGPDRLIGALEAANIESRPVWKPMHLQPVFAAAPRHVNGTSEGLFARGVCLPSGSGMTDRQVERVIETVSKEMRR